VFFFVEKATPGGGRGPGGFSVWRGWQSEIDDLL